MTIEAVETNASGEVIVTCVWFVEKSLYRTALPVSALTSAMWPIAA